MPESRRQVVSPPGYAQASSTAPVLAPPFRPHLQISKSGYYLTSTRRPLCFPSPQEPPVLGMEHKKFEAGM